MNGECEAMLLEASTTLKALFAEHASEEYASRYTQRRQWLRSAFRNYRSATQDEQRYLRRLVELHTKQCGSNPVSRRRHNGFVLMYITDQKYLPREIASMLHICLGSLWEDRDHVLDDMMLLAFGVDGIKPDSVR